jgi:hypothetical protein
LPRVDPEAVNATVARADTADAAATRLDHAEALAAPGAGADPSAATTALPERPHVSTATVAEFAESDVDTTPEVAATTTASSPTAPGHGPPAKPNGA